RRLLAWHGRGRDDHVALRHDFRHQLALPAIKLFVHRSGVTPLGLALAGGQRHLDEPRAQALHLFFDRRANVVGRNDRAHPAMACNPAAPAPTTKTLAGVIVPAAVVIIGNILPSAVAASSTAR